MTATVSGEVDDREPARDPLEIPFGPLGVEESISCAIFDGSFDAGRAARVYEAVLSDFEHDDIYEPLVESQQKEAGAREAAQPNAVAD